MAFIPLGHRTKSGCRNRKCFRVNESLGVKNTFDHFRFNMSTKGSSIKPNDQMALPTQAGYGVIG